MMRKIQRIAGIFIIYCMLLMGLVGCQRTNDSEEFEKYPSEIVSVEVERTVVAPAMDATITRTGTFRGGGPAWHLYSDGTLVVGAGAIDMTGMVRRNSPWPDGIRKIIFTGPITAGPSLSELFFGLDVEYIHGLEYFDTSNVTDMNRMFWNTRNITTLDLSGFDTSNVTDVSGMFLNMNSLTSLNLSGFNTANVTDMSHMFAATYNLSSLDLSSFDTRNVTTMRRMFSYSGVTSLDLSNFDTGSVTNMGWMFSSAQYLTKLNLSSFDTSNVIYMFMMFHDAGNLINLDLSSFDTGNVVSMSHMFFNARSLTNLDLSHFDTSNVVEMCYMFANTVNLKSLDISGFDTSNVARMSSMFHWASSLTSLDVSSFNTSNVTNMSWMFFGTRNLTSLDLSNFDTRNVIYAGSMFLGTSLNQITLGEHFHFTPERFRWHDPFGMPMIISYCLSHAGIPQGYWQNVGAGTVANPRGEFVFTARQFMAWFDGATMADTWVWVSEANFDIPFTDIEENHPALQAIWYLYGNGIMQGTSATTFGPDAHISREMVAAILFRLAGSPNVEHYDDVYINAIYWAAQNSIMLGIGGVQSALIPSNLTREQFATMLHRFAKLQGYDVTVSPGFTLFSLDVDLVSEWAYEGMVWAVSSRLITGPGPRMFRPLDYVTRVEVAVILERFVLALM